MNTVPTTFDLNGQVVAAAKLRKQAAPLVFKVAAQKLRSDPDPRSSAPVPVPAKQSKRRSI
jgi:hypothetical protein